MKKINGVNQNLGFTNDLNPVFTRHQKGAMTRTDISKKREQMKKEREAMPMAKYVKAKQQPKVKVPVHQARINGQKLRMEMIKAGLIILPYSKDYGFEPTDENVLSKYTEQAQANTAKLKEAISTINRLVEVGVEIPEYVEA